MGLDFVELIIRTEEVFSIQLPDEECQLVRTVGDLYKLVLDKLTLPYVPSIEIEADPGGIARPLRSGLRLSQWTAPDTWLTLKAVISDQLGIKRSAITELARFG